jgi:hypothetical protein
MGSDKVFIVGGRSFIYIMKSKGLKIVSWGTACFNVPHFEENISLNIPKVRVTKDLYNFTFAKYVVKKLKVWFFQTELMQHQTVISFLIVDICTLNVYVGHLNTFCLLFPFQ